MSFVVGYLKYYEVQHEQIRVERNREDRKILTIDLSKITDTRDMHTLKEKKQK